MILSRPREVTFIVAVIVAVLALLIATSIIANPFHALAVVWIALIAFAILAMGNLMKGL